MLASALQPSTAEDAAISLVVGDIGAGKSELLRAALDQADDGGGTILRAFIGCHPGDTPYAPWMSFLTQHPAIKNRLPAPLGDRTPAAQGPDELVRQAAWTLCEIAADQPMALVFDDIHWADASSLDLLLSIARQASDLPLTLILACETPLREGTPAAQFVPLLLRETPARSLELQSLSEDGVRRVVSSRFPDIEPAMLEELAQHVQQWSGGNPLYVSEILGGIASAEDIADAIATRRLDTLSFSLRQLAEYRLAQISARSRETIELASVIGDIFRLDLLIDVSEQDAERLMKDLEEAIDAGILVEERDGRLRFRYGVVRQLLTETQSGLRRRRRHRAVLEALQRSGRRDGSSLEIARHAEAAGDLETAVDAYEQAGHQAVKFFNMPEAGLFYRKALELARQTSVDPARQDLLRLQYADSIIRTDVAAAIREYEQVAARAFVRNDAATHGKARQRHAMALYETSHREDAQAILDELIPDLERREDWQTLADALVCAIYAAGSESDFQQVDLLSGKLMDVADRLSDASYGSLALAMSATADVARGEPARAPRKIRDAIAMVVEMGQLDIATPMTAVALFRIDLFANLHHPDDVQKLIDRGLELDAESNRRIGLPADQCECTPEFGYWWLLRGEWDRARAILPDPVALQSAPQPQVLKDAVHVIATEFAMSTGAFDDAEQYLNYLAPVPGVPPGDHGYQQWLMAAELRVRLSLEHDDLEEAERWIDALDRELEHKPHVPGELLLDLSRARVSLARGAPDVAGQIAETVTVRARQTQNMLALVEGLQLLAHARKGQGQREPAIETAGEAVIVAGQCRLAFLQLLARVSRVEVACATGATFENLQYEIDQLLEETARLGAGPAQARIQQADRLRSNKRPGGLTKREIDVLRLIVEGKTDNEIAELLYISPRTVSTHVGNMLAKTSVINRVELASWAHQNNALQ
ncbi:LuxR family transcriptional regulator [soil metagenome]